jgi:hypothetical protein
VSDAESCVLSYVCVVMRNAMFVCVRSLRDVHDDVRDVRNVIVCVVCDMLAVGVVVTHHGIASASA